MIYITGDLHGEIDIHKLSMTNFPEQKQMTKDDYVIIAGDFGLVWDGSKQEQYWQEWLNNRNFTTLWVCGNHENHYKLNQYKVSEFAGGKVHFITDDIIHLMRGQVFNINGLKFFTMGGAMSHDKQHRVEGISWWKEELPNYQEYDEALENLGKHNYQVDYIISHTGPKHVIEPFTYPEDNQLIKFFDEIDSYLQFKHWYFGHFHRDQQIDEKHTVVYNNIIPIVR